MKRICGVQHRFLQGDDEKRFRTEGFLHGPYFLEALELFELRTAANEYDRAILTRWQNLASDVRPEAEAGLDPLREGFLRFEEAVQAMQAGQSSHFYTIAAPREFYAQWLAARLAAFRKANPEVRYQLIGGDEVDFTEANLDVAVRLVEGPDELEGVQLAPAQRVVVAAEGAPDEWVAWPGASNAMARAKRSRSSRTSSAAPRTSYWRARRLSTCSASLRRRTRSGV